MKSKVNTAELVLHRQHDERNLVAHLSVFKTARVQFALADFADLVFAI